MSTEPTPAILASETERLRLDLGCGKSPREGYEGVDLVSSQAKHKVDLFKFPYHWKDSSVEAIHCSHFIEHLPARDVESRDIRPREDTLVHIEDRNHFVGKDFLLAFFDECYRILIPGGKMTVSAPAATSDRAFQDPTHRRFVNQHTFCYLNAEMRKLLEVDHYAVDCDFDYVVVPIIPIVNEITLLSPEAAARRFKSDWNVILDWRADLTSRKRG